MGLQERSALTHEAQRVLKLVPWHRKRRRFDCADTLTGGGVAEMRQRCDGDRAGLV